jgi:hypothetical protein
VSWSVDPTKRGNDMKILPAFTDEEIAYVRIIRTAEIRVTHDGRLEIWHPISDEGAAARLHQLLRGGIR